jgi:hypothetical protein
MSTFAGLSNTGNDLALFEIIKICRSLKLFNGCKDLKFCSYGRAGHRKSGTANLWKFITIEWHMFTPVSKSFPKRMMPP